MDGAGSVYEAYSARLRHQYEDEMRLCDERNVTGWRRPRQGPHEKFEQGFVRSNGETPSDPMNQTDWRPRVVAPNETDINATFVWTPTPHHTTQLRRLHQHSKPHQPHRPRRSHHTLPHHTWV